jgi:hypothetical protein
VEPVARDDPEVHVRFVGERGVLGGDRDVGQQHVLAVDVCRAVDGGDDRRLDLQEALQRAPSLPVDLVPLGRLEDLAW